MQSRTVVLLLVVFASAGVAAGGDAKADLKKFAGTWDIVSAHKDGKDAPANEVNAIRLTFSGKKVNFTKGKETAGGTIKLDPTKKPAQIDFVTDNGSAKGIYRFKGEMLELCVADPGQARPTEFKAPAGKPQITLTVWKRAKN
jgi:uncharacterized protein (TIGR03067 family)